MNLTRSIKKRIDRLNVKFELKINSDLKKIKKLLFFSFLSPKNSKLNNPKNNLIPEAIKASGRVLMICNHSSFKNHGATCNYYKIAKLLSKKSPVTYLCFGDKNITHFDQNLTYEEFFHGKNFYSKRNGLLSKLIKPCAKNNISPIIEASTLFNHRTDNELFCSRLKNELLNSDIIIIDHGFSYGLLKNSVDEDIFINKKIFYACHDVVYELCLNISQLYKDDFKDDAMILLDSTLENIRKNEQELIDISNGILLVSDHQVKVLKKHFKNIADSKINVVYSFNDETNYYFTREECKKNKNRLKIKNKNIVYIGTNWFPNISACCHIYNLAVTNLDINFIIVGSVNKYFKKSPILQKIFTLPNLIFTGPISYRKLYHLFSVCDFGINISDFSGGVSTKNFLYANVGLPIITNDVIYNQDKGLQKHLTCTNISDFRDVVFKSIAQLDIDNVKKFISDNRTLNKTLERYFLCFANQDTEINLYYWQSDKLNHQNIGDFLNYYYIKKLNINEKTDKRHVYLLCGSAISDYHIEMLLSQFNKIFFYSCGLRSNNKDLGYIANDSCYFLSKKYLNDERIVILGTRGYLSSEITGKKCIGDSALLLPIIYNKPKVSKKYHQKVIFIPHFSDERSKEEMLFDTKADEVLSPKISHDIHHVEEFIDRLTSAKFILTGSLHGAIIAYAYGIQFSFYSDPSGAIDCPFKWHDFASTFNKKPEFFSNIIEALSANYSINLPKFGISSLINNFPFKSSLYDLAKNSDLNNFNVFV